MQISYDFERSIIVTEVLKICGISNNLDGTEDNLIWEEGTGEGEEPDIVLPEDVCENEE